MPEQNNRTLRVLCFVPKNKTKQKKPAETVSVSVQLLSFPELKLRDRRADRCRVSAGGPEPPRSSGTCYAPERFGEFWHSAVVFAAFDRITDRRDYQSSGKLKGHGEI